MELSARDSAQTEFYKPGTGRSSASRLTDAALERNLLSLVAVESEATAEIVDHVAEFDRRRLFAPKRFPSMYAYCTKTLGYSEAAAYLRIYAGRLSREYPEILEMLRTRRLHLTAIRIVGPYLKPANFRELLDQSVDKTAQELKFLIAETAPKPEPMEVVRRLPTPSLLPPPSPPPAPLALPQPTEILTAPNANPPVREERFPVQVPRARIEPLTVHRVRFAFTGSDEFLQKVERARQLLKHRYPAGALEDIFAETIEFFLNVRDPARKTRAARPRAANPRSRRVPQWVKDVVFKRDGGRCAFESARGERCEERGGLEYDHVVPWAKCGPSNDPENVRLLCRTHNAFAAEKIFGRRRRRERPKSSHFFALVPVEKTTRPPRA